MPYSPLLVGQASIGTLGDRVYQPIRWRLFVEAARAHGFGNGESITSATLRFKLIMPTASHALPSSVPALQKFDFVGLFGRVHVAFLSRGVTDTMKRPLKTQGNMAQHTRHGNDRIRTGQNARSAQLTGLFL